MTPKEKAKELVNKYLKSKPLIGSYIVLNTDHAKQCALICVDEIIKQWEYIDIYLADLNGELNPNLKYWIEVKKEINYI